MNSLLNRLKLPLIFVAILGALLLFSYWVVNGPLESKHDSNVQAAVEHVRIGCGPEEADRFRRLYSEAMGTRGRAVEWVEQCVGARARERARTSSSEAGSDAPE